jgi:tetratricopeptide (TPR) repeat protein
MLINDKSFFERTAASVWVANKDLSSALQVLEEGFKQNPSDEQLACQVLELAKLNNRTVLLDEVLHAFDGKEIQSTDLIWLLGESALMRGQEMLAAQYLSKIIGNSANQLRPKALQSIMLKRNNNESDAKLIYTDLITEMRLDHSAPNTALNIFDNQFWLATLAYEMDDFSKTLDISRDEMTKFGQVPGLVNIYLQAMLGLLRKNVLFESLNCSSRVQKLTEEQISLFGQIEKDIEENIITEFDDLSYRMCKVYMGQEDSVIDSLIRSASDHTDRRDLVYLSMLWNGYEKTVFELLPKLNDHQDLTFFAAITANEHPEESLEMVQDHINLLSNDPIHLALLAKIYFLLENQSEAYAAITLALNIEPNEYGWEILAGEISQKKGDMIVAIEHFERANRMSKKSSLIEQLNDLNILTGSEQAIPVLESKFTDDSSNFDLAMKIATLCLNFNKPGKAAYYFETVIKLNPKDHHPYAGLSRLSIQIGNLDKAYEYISKGLDLCERDFDLLLIKTDLIKRMRGLQEAKDFLENQVVLNDDTSDDLQAILADIIFEMNGLDECLAFITSKVFQQTNSVKFLTTRVKYLLIAGDNHNAKESLEKILNEYPDHAEVNAMMGDYYRIQGDLDQAIGHYLRAINLDPLIEKNFFNLFEIYNDQRDSESAKETLKSGMKAIPYSVAIPIKLSKYFLQHGLIEQADAIIERALRLRPRDEEAGTLKNLITQQRLTLNHKVEIITK